MDDVLDEYTLSLMRVIKTRAEAIGADVEPIQILETTISTSKWVDAMLKGETPNVGLPITAAAEPVRQSMEDPTDESRFRLKAEPTPEMPGLDSGAPTERELPPPGAGDSPGGGEFASRMQPYE